MPENIFVECREEETVFEAALREGIKIDGNCSGRGTCGKCKVKISGASEEEGEDSSAVLSEKERELGYRLACRCKVREGIVVEIPDTRSAASRKEDLMRLPEDFKSLQSVEKYCLSPGENDLSSFRSIEGKLCGALLKKGIEAEKINHTALKKIGEIDEKQSLTITVKDKEIVDIEQGDRKSENYGIAVDIGTTTLVVMLWNLHNARMEGVKAVTNPQAICGADVVSRISFAEEAEGNLDRLRQVLIEGINEIIAEICDETSISENNIYSYAVVGNTTMSHIFLGADPSSLARAPFTPLFTREILLKSSELGLRGNPQAEVFLTPNIAGHVGSDITAGILSTDLMKKDRGHLFIDIGTNGEIVLSGKGRVTACSTAAGPAFEGSSIKQGMRAADGAIEKVKIEGKELFIRTIGDQRPIGICGSGIIDAIGEMVRVGLIDKNGKILGEEKLLQKGIPKEIAGRVRTGEKGNSFCLYRGERGEIDIEIFQKDIREVQLAKAAIAAGIQILMKKTGLSPDEIERISIAGAFGSYINVQSAMNMGLLPSIETGNVKSLGNCAGIGASMILLSDEMKRACREIAEEIEHIELSSLSDFQEEYIRSMRF